MKTKHPQTKNFEEYAKKRLGKETFEKLSQQADQEVKVLLAIQILKIKK